MIILLSGQPLGKLCIDAWFPLRFGGRPDTECCRSAGVKIVSRLLKQTLVILWETKKNTAMALWGRLFCIPVVNLDSSEMTLSTETSHNAGKAGTL